MLEQLNGHSYCNLQEHNTKQVIQKHMEQKWVMDNKSICLTSRTRHRNELIAMVSKHKIDIYILTSMHPAKQVGSNSNTSNLHSRGNQLKPWWDTSYPDWGWLQFSSVGTESLNWPWMLPFTSLSILFTNNLPLSVLYYKLMIASPNKP
jgi:hypothetical protein